MREQHAFLGDPIEGRRARVRIAEDAGVPVVKVETPMECVVLGAGQCIESFEAMRVMFMEGRR